MATRAHASGPPDAADGGAVASAAKPRTGAVLLLLLPVMLTAFLLSLQRRNAQMEAALAPPKPAGRAEEPIRPLPLGTRLRRLWLRDRRGAMVTSLGELGKPQILIVMALRRPPCEAERRQIDNCRALQQRYRDARLCFSVITDVEPSALAQTARRYGIPFPLFSDIGHRTAKAFHIGAGFEMYVINARGELAFHQMAPVELDGSPLVHYLDSVTSPDGAGGGRTL